MSGRDLIARDYIDIWMDHIKSRVNRRVENVRNDRAIFVGGKQYLEHLRAISGIPKFHTISLSE